MTDSKSIERWTEGESQDKYASDLIVGKIDNIIENVDHMFIASVVFTIVGKCFWVVYLVAKSLHDDMNKNSGSLPAKEPE